MNAATNSSNTSKYFCKLSSIREMRNDTEIVGNVRRWHCVRVFSFISELPKLILKGRCDRPIASSAAIFVSRRAADNRCPGLNIQVGIILPWLAWYFSEIDITFALSFPLSTTPQFSQLYK